MQPFGINNPGIPPIGNRYVYATNDADVVVDGNLAIAEDAVETFRLNFADFGLPFGQILPIGTTIEVTADSGTLTGTTSYLVPNSIGSIDPTAFSGDKIIFSIGNPNTVATAGDLPIAGTLTVKVSTPKGIITTMNFNYTLSGN